MEMVMGKSIRIELVLGRKSLEVLREMVGTGLCCVVLCYSCC